MTPGDDASRQAAVTVRLGLTLHRILTVGDRRDLGELSAATASRVLDLLLTPPPPDPAT